jgi:hypothetical protein
VRIRCIANRGSGLTGPYYEPAEGFSLDAEFKLTVGHQYVVYGLGFRKTQMWYYIADDAFVDGPRGYPHCLFEIDDGNRKNRWMLRMLVFVARGGRSADRSNLFLAERLPITWPCAVAITGGARSGSRRLRQRSANLAAEQPRCSTRSERKSRAFKRLSDAHLSVLLACCERLRF